MRYVMNCADTNSNVSVTNRMRGVVVAVVTRGLRALEEVRFLLQWLPRHAQAAQAVALKRPAKPAAARAMGYSGLGSPDITSSRWGLGGPGSGSPSGRF